MAARVGSAGARTHTHTEKYIDVCVCVRALSRPGGGRAGGKVVDGYGCVWGGHDDDGVVAKCGRVVGDDDVGGGGGGGAQKGSGEGALLVRVCQKGRRARFGRRSVYNSGSSVSSCNIPCTISFFFLFFFLKQHFFAFHVYPHIYDITIHTYFIQ